LGLKIEAADSVHRGPGNGDLNHAIGSRALGVDDAILLARADEVIE
jgi:hypothetical protein